MTVRDSTDWDTDKDRFTDDPFSRSASVMDVGVDRLRELFNDQRVYQLISLLQSNDGDVSKADIAEELGWGLAKTDYVVRELDELGLIETYSMGRHNRVMLPSAVPEPLVSPTPPTPPHPAPLRVLQAYFGVENATDWPHRECERNYWGRGDE